MSGVGVLGGVGPGPPSSRAGALEVGPAARSGSRSLRRAGGAACAMALEVQGGAGARPGMRGAEWAEEPPPAAQLDPGVGSSIGGGGRLARPAVAKNDRPARAVLLLPLRS